MSPAPRFVPMLGDSMAPTVNPGDMVAALPVSSYCGEGLYVICEAGSPIIVRASSDFRGGMAMSFDNARYSPWTLTRDDFSAALLGKVFAVCRLVDRSLMERVGMIDAQRPTAGWLLGRDAL